MNPRDYSKNVYSQQGEDGILEKIFETLQIESGTFVEVGATDGIYFSNTRNLLINKGWTGVYIEGVENFYGELLANTNGYPVQTINKFISCEPGFSLNEILGELRVIKQNFDLFSLDIDGNDYWVWKQFTYEPKVVVAEYNPFFPVSCSVSIEYDPKFVKRADEQGFGASAGALLKLAEEKGYTLVAYTDCLNLVFVNNRYADGFSVVNPNMIPTAMPSKPTSVKMVEV